MIDETALKSIQKLHEMKASGIISEEEFEEGKRELLAGKRAGPRSTQADSTVPERPADQDHLAWALLPLRKYAQFSGRAARREFWMFLLGINVIGAVLALTWAADTNAYGLTGTVGNIVFILFLLGVLAVIVPYVAVQVRRFHDQGKSGWFALLNLIPYVGAFIVLAFMLIEGSPEDNEFGENPKN